MMMMEEENPVERVHEDLHHAAERSGEKWTLGVALSSAILAAIASVGSLYSGHMVNFAMTSQIKASDQWAHYQSKSIKAAVLTSQAELLKAMKQPVPETTASKLEQYKRDQESLQEKAETLEKGSEHAFERHEVFARAVTLFQVAIAVAAVSVLTRRRKFWWVSLGFGAVGLAFFLQGLWLDH